MASDITPGRARFASVRAGFLRVALGLRHLRWIGWLELECFGVHSSFTNGIVSILILIYNLRCNVDAPALGHKSIPPLSVINRP